MGSSRLKPRSAVILIEAPAALLHDLPEEDQAAIRAIVGKPVRLLQYDELGRAELEFTDANGTIHFIWVKPEHLRPVVFGKAEL